MFPPPGSTARRRGAGRQAAERGRPRPQAVAFRKVLRDDGKGRLDAEVEQVGQWRFLCFSGSFSTRLYVCQDRRRGTVRPSARPRRDVVTAPPQTELPRP
jgi:hypothetical protein